jgi:tetrapyrrole methylase family protein/MazG family protein
MRAEKVGKKASCFDFPDADSVMQKVYEELDELKGAMLEGNAEHIEEEMGDLLLTVTSLCRKVGVESEIALSKATNKFIYRFEKIENAVLSEGLQMSDLSLAELDAIWDKNKKENNNS